MKIEIYCDESRHDLLANQQIVTENNRYTVVGGIWLENSIRENLKNEIKSLQQKYHTYGEIKWNNVSNSRLEFYKLLIELFFTYHLELRFRAIVIDALTVDLAKFHNSDAELGFYKFYYQLLIHWININDIYYIFTDYKRNRKNNRILELKEIINSAKYSSTIKHIQAIDSKESLILQLEDLIMGAVGYKYNFGYNGKSRAKMEIVNLIENKLARSITNTNRNEEKFNIFEIQLDCGDF
jgi:hypothetical protein